MSVSQKIDEYRRNAAACEDWALTVIYPDMRRGILKIAKHWREMAARCEMIENVERDFEVYRRNALRPLSLGVIRGPM
jgi:hypothetical protein